MGEETFVLKLVTTNLVTPVEILVHLHINVVSGESMLSSGIKAFARADNSFEKFLDCHTEEENRITTDSELWKVLLPVVRLSNKKPSRQPVNLKSCEVPFLVSC